MTNTPTGDFDNLQEMKRLIQEAYGQTDAYKPYPSPNSAPYYPTTTHPCPSCGHCPTCGRSYWGHQYRQPEVWCKSEVDYAGNPISKTPAISNSGAAFTGQHSTTSWRGLAG